MLTPENEQNIKREEVTNSMKDIRYQVSLIADGKETLTITAMDPNAACSALRWLSTSHQSDAPAFQPKLMADQAVPAPKREQAEAPLCGIHQTPMTWVDRNGGFWSCHKRMPDNSWCKYKPTR